MSNSSHCPQIKICGLTHPDEAEKCAQLGADAIGLVFFPKSPRFVSDLDARKISEALPGSVQKVGVFVNEPFENIMEKVCVCNLTAVQLHGSEPASTSNRLLQENLIVIKGLFCQKAPYLAEASNFPASAYLVECGKGKLPGGNAMTWNYSEASIFGKDHPMILAGGLNPDNVAKAIAECRPDAVDVSSGVEKAPGRKDLEKVKRFIEAVINSNSFKELSARKLKRVF